MSNRKHRTHTLSLPAPAEEAEPLCMNMTVAASGEFRFKIDAYSFTKVTVTSEREYYQSDMFRVGLQEWALRYYPNRGGGDGPAAFRVVLVLLSRLVHGIAVRFVLTTLRDGKTPSCKMTAATAANVDCDSAPAPGLLYAPREVLSFVINHAAIEEFVVGDSFVLQATVSVLKRPKSA